MDDDDFPLYPVKPSPDVDGHDRRPFVRLWATLCPGGDTSRDGSLDRSPAADALCEELAAAMTARGLRARVDASAPGTAREDAYVRVEVAGRLHLAVMVGDGSALMTGRGLHDRAFDVEVEFAQVDTAVDVVREVTGWLPVRPDQTIEDERSRARVRAAPGWHPGMPDGPPSKSMSQIVAEALAEHHASPPSAAQHHPRAVARLRRAAEDAAARGRNRWERRWTVTEVREDLVWLKLLGVDGVRVTGESPSVTLTAWVVDPGDVFVCLERDGRATRDEISGETSPLGAHDEVLRVVRAVVGDALEPWRGWPTRRTRGWRVKDEHGWVRLRWSRAPGSALTGGTKQ